MKRIMIIGAAGAGKSTAARMIGAALDLPVYHMDREVYWLPGWIERPEDERRALVAEIAAKEAWVFEGNYSSTFQVRRDRAQMLIWLDTPALLRLWRAIRRAIVQNGRTRVDMADGCVEQLRNLPGFIRFIVTTAHRSRQKSGAFYATVDFPKHRFTSAKQVNAFVAGLSNQ